MPAFTTYIRQLPTGGTGRKFSQVDVFLVHGPITQLLRLRTIATVGSARAPDLVAEHMGRGDIRHDGPRSAQGQAIAEAHRRASQRGYTCADPILSDLKQRFRLLDDQLDRALTAGVRMLVPRANEPERERWWTIAEVLLVAAAWHGQEAQVVGLFDEESGDWRRALAAEWAARPYRLVADAQIAPKFYIEATDAVLAQLPSLPQASAVDYLCETIYGDAIPGPWLLRRAVESGLRFESCVDRNGLQVSVADVLDAFSRQGKGAAAAWAQALIGADLRPTGRRARPVPTL